MDILVSADQLETIMKDGRLNLVLDTSGDLNGRMVRGQNVFNHVAVDPVAVVRLSTAVQLENMPISAVFIGSLIMEIHSTVPCRFEPCFMYDSIEHAKTLDGHSAVKAALRAILRPRLLDKCPREIFTQDERVDPYMDRAYRSLIEDGEILDHAIRQTSSLANASLIELLNKRFDGNVELLKETMRQKWR